MPRKVIVTGGAGFIGCNTADRFASLGDQVVVIDNFSRKGATQNAQWLKNRHPSVKIHKVDVARQHRRLPAIFKDADIVFHFAGQVAVTTSVTDPRRDLEDNIIGTFHVLETVRQNCPNAVLLYSSTNKVYGRMEDLPVRRNGLRYEYVDMPSGIPETRPLDFHSPYGCSKGAADQYVRDYHRIYGLKTIVFRQSCIYGYRQFGLEDQGWVAWFTIAALLGRPVTIYGDGLQVRDVLFIDDLVDAYEKAAVQPKTYGQVYNIGGGPSFTISLLELLEYLECSLGRPVNRSFSDWRPGDQPVYISDIRKAAQDFGWQPRVSVQEGVSKLIRWVQNNKRLFA